MGSRVILKGVYPAIVTCFNEKGEIDFEKLGDVIDYVMRHGCSGLVVAGTTGEFIYLSDIERKNLIKFVVEYSDGKYPVIAGTGSADTHSTLELSRFAADIGSDALLVVSPYYIKTIDKELHDHYIAIANNVDIPVILYNIPQVTGVELPWWVVEALADHRNIVGIKDSSGNMPYFMTLIEKLKDKFYILCGHDEIATSALLSGADGVILASANILPDIWVNIYSSIVAGKVDMALELQRRIQTIVRLIVKGGPVAVKSALNMIGIDAGGSRIPLIRGGRYRYEDEDLLRHHLFKLGKIAKKKIKIVSDGAEFDHEYPAISYTPPTLSSFEIKVGESFTSPGTVDLAHIDLIIGYRNGPVGAAFDKALNEKLAGHEPQVVKYEGMDVEPITILIPTVRVVNEVHHNLIYKYASRGIARAILECVEDGYIPHKLKDKLCIIAHVFVHPEATNRRRIEINNYKAMLNALIRAIENRPCIEELEELYRYSRHPFRYTP